MNSEGVLVKLVIGGLLTWRLASLLTGEDGPLRVFDRIREALGVYNLDEEERPRSELGRLLECLWCVSVWIAFPVSVLFFAPDIVEILVMTPVISAVAILIDSEVKRM